MTYVPNYVKPKSTSPKDIERALKQSLRQLGGIKAASYAGTLTVSVERPATYPSGRVDWTKAHVVLKDSVGKLHYSKYVSIDLQTIGKHLLEAYALGVKLEKESA